MSMYAGGCACKQTLIRRNRLELFGTVTLGQFHLEVLLRLIYVLAFREFFRES